MKKEYIIGFIAISGIAILVFGINYLKGKDILNQQNEFHAIYQKVEGLKIGNSVLINGYEIGNVSGIQPRHYNTGEVDFIVSFFVKNRGITIYKNTVAKITNSDFLGTKAIDLELNTDSTYTVLKEGDTLKSAIDKGISQAVIEELVPLKNQLEAMFKEVEGVLVTIKGVFDEKASSDIKQSLSSIKSISKNLHHTTDSLNLIIGESKPKVNKIFTKTESVISSIDSKMEGIDKIITNLSVVSDSLTHVNLSETLTSFDNTITDLNEVVSSINDENGSLGKLIKSDTMYLNIEKTVNNLDLLLEDFRLKPKRYMPLKMFNKKYKPHADSNIK